MSDVFAEISLVLAIALAVAAVMQLLRQPLVIGHILTGLLVGPGVLNIIRSPETLEVFSHLGIALLLFIIGLSLNPRVVKEVGRTALITGVGQVVFTTGLGFGVARLLGLETVAALYVAVAISFSSTIIIMKLLSDKRELGRLYGKISTGFLLVQDLLATVILIGVTSAAQNQSLPQLLSTTALRVAVLVLAFAALTYWVLPRLSGFLAKSQEFLFLFSIGWGLGIAALFHAAGLSIEIGALFAGVALATSPYNYEISARLRPLRDFFIVLFFILLGSQMAIGNIGALIGPALALALIILIGNPLVVMTLMAYLGYTKKTNFKAGLAVAQISEFSLILVVLGNRVGHLPPDIISLVTLVALITIATSTYLIIYADGIYQRIAPALSLFERRDAKRERSKRTSHDIVLFGYRRAGFQFVESFRQLGQKFVVVDFNPEVIDELAKQKIPAVYGDANDSELLDSLELDNAKLVISTIPDFAANSLIVQHVQNANPNAIVVVTSDEIDEADELYRYGATYVLMPHYLGSSKTSALIAKHGFDLSIFIKERNKHISYLQQRRQPVAR
ncbi:cation:proton antiporter [Candidatus Parcubacteria bacterium]|nr:cation:proton antiporter [Candidatus Parcubacteria bacterium]